MKLLLISLSLLWTSVMPKTPNFYPSFTSAREASKSTQKDLVMFFNKVTCTNCDLAWAAFEKDGGATNKYISTTMDAEDFDGGIFFEKYELTTTPAWVILTPEGKIREKWEGGWKDASGNPSLFDQSVSNPQDQNSLTVSRSESKPQVSESMTTSKALSQPTKSSPSTIVNTPSVKTPASSAPTSTSVVTPSPVASGFILQAGYFGSEANAQKLIGELKGKGFALYSIKPTTQNGSNFYRVISKSFATEFEANKELQSLSTGGFKATVKKGSEI